MVFAGPVGRFTAQGPDTACEQLGRLHLPALLELLLPPASRHHGKGLGTGLLNDANGRTLAAAEIAGIRLGVECAQEPAVVLRCSVRLMDLSRRVALKAAAAPKIGSGAGTGAVV
jgi:hypothetical protein